MGLFLSVAVAGDIQGQVLVTHGLTKKKVTLPSYQVRGPSPRITQEESDAINELSRIVIYVEGPPKSSGKAGIPKLTQQNAKFVPQILAVPVGSTVQFPNADPIFHNVFSLSKVKQFDLGFYPAGESRSVMFEQAGLVQVYCHLHPQMNAAILVTPNPWYAQPDGEGKFVIAGVPAGTYDVVAWHKSAGFFRQSVAVPESGTVEISFNIPVADREGKQ